MVSQMVRRARQFAGLPPRYLPIPLEDVEVVGFPDAAFERDETGKSQMGWLM